VWCCVFTGAHRADIFILFALRMFNCCILPSCLAFGVFYLDLHTPVGVGESRVMALLTMTASLSEGRVRSEAAAFNSLATGREQAAGVGVYGSHTTAAVPVQTGL